MIARSPRLAPLLAATALALARAAGAADGGSPPSSSAVPPSLPCPSAPECSEDPGDDVVIQTTVDPDYGLLGFERFRVNGAELVDPALVKLQVAMPLFLAKDDDQMYWKGLVEPKGKSGLRFRWFLNAQSRAALAAKLSAGASAAVGKPITVALVGTPRLVLETSADGSEVELRIRARGTGPGGAKVRYRATLSGVAMEMPAPLP